jgi:hypothetical protein
LAVLQDEFNLDGRAIPKALTPFPRIALRGDPCGAEVGSLMAMRLACERDDLEDWHGYITSLPPGRRFTSRFEELHAHSDCASILESRFGRKFTLADTAQGLEVAEADGPDPCGKSLARAEQIAAELITNKTGPGGPRKDPA